MKYLPAEGPDQLRQQRKLTGKAFAASDSSSSDINVMCGIAAADGGYGAGCAGEAVPPVKSGVGSLPARYLMRIYDSTAFPDTVSCGRISARTARTPSQRRLDFRVLLCCAHALT